MNLNEHSTYSKARIVESVSQEYEYIHEQYENRELKFIEVTTKKHKDKSYDLMKFNDIKTNTTFTVYFDISSFFGNPEKVNKAFNKMIADKRKKDFEIMNELYFEILSMSDEFVSIYNDLFNINIIDKDYNSKLIRLGVLLNGINRINTELNSLGDYEPKKTLLPHVKNVRLSIILTLPIVIKLENKAVGGSYSLDDYEDDKKKLDSISDDFDQTITAFSILSN